MATYHFWMKTGARLVRDPIGVEFPDDEAAEADARAIIRDLMRNRESRTRHWRIRVRRESGEPCFDILFASVDQMLDGLDETFRRSVEGFCGNMADLADSIRTLRYTLLQVNATMARADAKLHLAAVDSVRA